MKICHFIKRARSRASSGRTLRRSQSIGLLLGGLVFAASTHAQTVIFSETFGPGLGKFTAAGSVSTSSGNARMAGCYGCTDGAITSQAISTVGFSGLKLSFDRVTSGLDSGEAGVAEYSTNGSTYTAVESIRSASGRITFNLPASAENQSSLRLRFRINASLSSETYTVDNVALEGSSGTSTPGGTLPPVSSVETDGPFATTITQSTGPARSGWIGRPTTLGANGLKHPIFIWGPGAGAAPSNYEWLLRRLASHGFVVYSEVSINTGSEMKAAIDWIIAENGRSASPYYQKLDTSKIAAGGHSRGSISTFGVASDPRLTTTIHVAGGSFDGTGPSNLRKPAAYFCGEADTAATPNCRRDYTNTTVPVFFTIMDNVNHTDAARSSLPATVAWLRWHLGGETSRRGMFLDPTCYFCTGMWSSQHKNW
jgi:hypothetical protein